MAKCVHRVMLLTIDYRYEALSFGESFISIEDAKYNAIASHAFSLYNTVETSIVENLRQIANELEDGTLYFSTISETQQ